MWSSVPQNALKKLQEQILAISLGDAAVEMPFSIAGTIDRLKGATLQKDILWFTHRKIWVIVGYWIIFNPKVAKRKKLVGSEDVFTVCSE